MPYTDEIVLGESKSSFLFIGPPGRGKTLAAASFSDIGPLETIDFDDRMQPVKLFYPNLRFHFSKFNVSSLREFAYTYMPELLKRCDYRVVHLAGLTSLSMCAITYQMNEARGSTEAMKIVKGGIMVPGWDQFNGEAMILSQTLDMLKSLPAHLIMEAHPVSRTNMDGGTKYTSLVAFGPKVESLVPGYFNEIYYFDVEVDMQGGRKYICVTKPSEQYPLAKTALPLPTKFNLTDDDGKPIPLYPLIQEELRKHNIKLSGE